MVKKHGKLKLVLLISSVLLLMILTVFLVGKSFGFFQYAKKGDVVNIITISGLSVKVDESTSNALNLVDTYPKYDNDGLQANPFTFTITNSTSDSIDYTLKLLNDTEKQATCFTNQEETIPCTLLPYEYIRYSYSINDGSYTTPATLTASGDIYTETISSSASTKIAIKIWISNDAPNSIQGNVFLGKLVLTGETITAWDFEFDSDNDGNGQIQTFTAPYAGKYQLEVWGAQGGNVDSTYYGGYGAYSVGNIILTANQTLYVVVGGSGGNISGNNINANGGGYNGGGGSSYYWSEAADTEVRGFGGGATHIATTSGLLSSLKNEKDNILIVGAGGSGAQKYYNSSSVYSYTIGASGGGIEGNLLNFTGTNAGVTSIKNAYSSVSKATNQAGGSLVYSTMTISGSFGQGASGYGGAGGGFYGGTDLYGITGGGSSYIASSLLTQNTSSNIINKMYCYGCTESSELSTYTVSTYGTTTHSEERDTTNCPNGYSSEAISKCAKAENGHARITYLGNN